MDQKLETFLTLCKTMHYGRAAELLHLSQPAVSKHIQAIEAQYGVRLFTYQARRLQKTREGDLLEQYAFSLRYNEEMLLARLHEKSKTLLRIGATKSIGDYILTGGEIASMVVMDAVIRLLKGSITEGSADDESYENGLLEYPQYTQPAVYNGESVPEVLLSGHHAKIEEYRIEQSLLITKERRPDLFEKHVFTPQEEKILKRLKKEGKI